MTNNGNDQQPRGTLAAIALFILATVTAAALGCGGGGGSSGSDDADNGTETPSPDPADPPATTPLPDTLSAGDTFTTTAPQLSSIIIVDGATAELVTDDGTGFAAVTSYSATDAQAVLALTVLPDFQATLGLIDATATFTGNSDALSVTITGSDFAGSPVGPIAASATFTDN